MSNSSPEAWHDDFFDKDDFQDSIDQVCTYALRRLKRFRDEDYSKLGEGDVLAEHIVGAEQEKVETQLRLFASAFDSLHSDLLIQDTVPDYFRGIIASLVKNSLQWQAESAGNVVTQLLPDDEALRAHVDEVWQWQKLQRHNRCNFTVYRFYLGRDIADIMFRPESSLETWSLGYQVDVNRLLFHWGRHFYEESDGVLAADPITATDVDVGCD